jgi:hypothetical protein
MCVLLRIIHNMRIIGAANYGKFTVIQDEKVKDLMFSLGGEKITTQAMITGSSSSLKSWEAFMWFYSLLGNALRALLRLSLMMSARRFQLRLSGGYSLSH